MTRHSFLPFPGAHSALIEGLQDVLDDETDIFVIKLWRFLIYEAEAKKFGLPPAASS